MVRAGGFEPPRSFEHGHLKTARLPFRHARNASKRTNVDSPDFGPDSASSVAGRLVTRSEEELGLGQRLLARGMDD